MPKLYQDRHLSSTKVLEGSAEMTSETARTSPSPALHVVNGSADLGDFLRRARRKKRWTQAQLAQFCDVRVQTVSAWETGKRPQRRFFAKIADFLELRDEASVEALLDAERRFSDAMAVPQQEPQHHESSAQMAELQKDVLQSVTRLLARNTRPSGDLVRLLQDLLASVGLPQTIVAETREPGHP